MQATIHPKLKFSNPRFKTLGENIILLVVDTEEKYPSIDDFFYSCTKSNREFICCDTDNITELLKVELPAIIGEDKEIGDHWTLNILNIGEHRLRMIFMNLFHVD